MLFLYQRNMWTRGDSENSCLDSQVLCLILIIPMLIAGKRSKTEPLSEVMINFLPRVDSTLILVDVSITCFWLASFLLSLLSLIGQFSALFFFLHYIPTLLVLPVNENHGDAQLCEQQSSIGRSQFCAWWILWCWTIEICWAHHLQLMPSL